jgi:hypothetical protein
MLFIGVLVLLFVVAVAISETSWMQRAVMVGAAAVAADRFVLPANFGIEGGAGGGG